MAGRRRDRFRVGREEIQGGDGGRSGYWAGSADEEEGTGEGRERRKEKKEGGYLNFGVVKRCKRTQNGG